MEENSKLPYYAEYAKSGRAGCKGCKENIAKDSLRLAVMVQSPFFDGMQPKWHHYSCFFKKFRPKATSDIGHFESLRWDDQQNIQKKIENVLENPADEIDSGKKKKKSKKRAAEPTVNIPGIGDYTIEYSKSSRAKCKVCEETILKDVIRISKKDYESEIAMKYGPAERWHHVDCFVKAREELEFFGSGSALPGYKRLNEEDQTMIKNKIPEIQRSDSTEGPSPPKKPKEKEDPSLKRKLKKQNETIFKYNDLLQPLKKPELVSLLEFNHQDIPEGVVAMVERLSDAMAFGAIEKCKKCKGQFTFCSGKGYQCLGYVSEWLKCEEVTSKPSRVPFKVPSELKEKYPFLKSYKGKVSERLFVQNTTTDTSNSKSATVLSSLKFFVHKTNEKKLEDVKEQIKKLGGDTVKKFEEGIAAVVSTKTEIKKSSSSKTLKLAKDTQTPVLPENFFDGISQSTSKKELLSLMSDKKISPWDFTNKTIKMEENPVKKSVYPVKEASSTKSKVFKSNETIKKVTLKDGLAVDPDSQLEKVAHVYRKGNDIYSVVLSLTDVQAGKNSYYKMQILESDKAKKYWLFRAWGRIGTTIGGNKCDQYESLNDCIEIFEEVFEEQTGNLWEKRKNFKKRPGKKIMLEVEYEEQKESENLSKRIVESKTLSKSVQDLITLIFDIEAMKRTMLEFELDLNKMPLGKLSQKQIQKAFAILSDLQTVFKENFDKSQIVEKTNIFYSLVPHDFGILSPPLLDNEEIIKQKIDILNSLMDIEIAYKLLQECENSNSVDDHYMKLNAEIQDLNPESEEFRMIELYVKNTHAKTHMNYSLQIENIFKVERKDEAKKFKKFSKLENRKLLWHGSRVTNFAGILSQGLRIAPPEAPVTGYMFGKGIYFADMVSKSANYCNTSKKNPTGLLLLCEVALGEMLELTSAKNIEKLPSGKHSVKGVGKTHPDPNEVITTASGAQIPVGKGVESKVKNSALLYNEYIVYDVGQVKIQYLLRLKFVHKV